jgi:hypothetical protein
VVFSPHCGNHAFYRILRRLFVRLPESRPLSQRNAGATLRQRALTIALAFIDYLLLTGSFTACPEVHRD